MNDGFKLRGTIEWKHFDGIGNLVDSGVIHNQIQDELFQEAIDAFQAGTFDNPLGCMAVGTGTGQDVTDTTLNSYLSYENSAGSAYTESQPSAAQSQLVCTFTGMAANTITEAGMFGGTAHTDHMMCYNDGLSVSIGGTSDSLEITWTLDASV